MASDLQDEPEVIDRFIEEWKKGFVFFQKHFTFLQIGLHKT
jgi:hypothetical protein